MKINDFFGDNCDKSEYDLEKLVDKLITLKLFNFLTKYQKESHYSYDCAYLSDFIWYLPKEGDIKFIEKSAPISEAEDGFLRHIGYIGNGLNKYRDMETCSFSTRWDFDGCIKFDVYNIDWEIIGTIKFQTTNHCAKEIGDFLRHLSLNRLRNESKKCQFNLIKQHKLKRIAQLAKEVA